MNIQLHVLASQCKLVHTSAHHQSTSPPPASFSMSSTFEKRQKCALQPNTVPGRLKTTKKTRWPCHK